MPNRPDHASGLGFWASKTLLSAIEIALFTELAKHPEDAQTLRGRLGLDPRSALDLSAGDHGTGYIYHAATPRCGAVPKKWPELAPTVRRRPWYSDATFGHSV